MAIESVENGSENAGNPQGLYGCRTFFVAHHRICYNLT